MVDKFLTAVSESTKEHHSAIPLHQPSAASLNSDNSSSDLICHPSLPNSQDYRWNRTNADLFPKIKTG